MKKLIILIEIIIIALLFIAIEPVAEVEPKYFEMIATAYTPGAESCWPFDDGFTATGDIAGYGSIAIDPDAGILKMGQRVYVEGYGIGKCNDVGSAIKGWRIDLCFNTLEEAQEWGIKKVKVYILEGE